MSSTYIIKYQYLVGLKCVGLKRVGEPARLRNFFGNRSSKFREFYQFDFVNLEYCASKLEPDILVGILLNKIQGGPSGSIVIVMFSARY